MRKDIRAIIVDDELGCIANLQHYLTAYCAALRVVATASTLESALQVINDNDFDVAFFDIQLFKENVFNLIEKLEQINFEIVFVTAYDNFAVKAFKVEALDYLLKPLSKDDVVECYNKIQKRLKGEQQSLIQEVVADRYLQRKVILKQGEAVFVVKETEILYLKAKGFYTEIYFTYHGKLITVLISKPISVLEKEYSSDIFFRIHKSYLVNVHHVMHIVKAENTFLKLNTDELLPVAKRRMKEFIEFVKMMGECGGY